MLQLNISVKFYFILHTILRRPPPKCELTGLMEPDFVITETLGAPVYFCDSRSPWQRGSNENTNGLLRDYFPKGTDLRVHPVEHLVAIENELNNRPRRVLGDRSPTALFDALLPSPPHTVLQR